MSLTIREIEDKENNFTKAFFEDFLRKVTSSTQKEILASITGKELKSIRNIHIERHLEGGTRPDIEIELEDHDSIFIEVKIHPQAYRQEQIYNHIKDIANGRKRGFYIFIDKSRKDFADLANQFKRANCDFPKIITKHTNWFYIYDKLAEIKQKFNQEHKDHFLIEEILEKMEEIGMKPFKGLDEEQKNYLAKMRDKPGRDISSEIDELCIGVLDEIEYQICLKYPELNIEWEKRNEIHAVLLNGAIENEINPYVYCYWDARAKKFHVFIELDKESDEGYVFSYKLFLELADILCGKSLVLELNSKKPNEFKLDDWVKDKKELPNDCDIIWVGKYIFPEQYKQRELVDEIVSALSLLIDSCTNFLQNIKGKK
jgi:hypothetical protein